MWVKHYHKIFGDILGPSDLGEWQFSDGPCKWFRGLLILYNSGQLPFVGFSNNKSLSFFCVGCLYLSKKVTLTEDLKNENFSSGYHDWKLTELWGASFIFGDDIIWTPFTLLTPSFDKNYTLAVLNKKKFSTTMK